MHLFSLNDDILSLIIAGLSPFDASQVMMTSRSGYDIAIPRFLSEVAFTRRTPISAKRVRQFCDFMLADPRRRIPCLRALTLDGPALADSNFEYPCPCHLSKVLAFATGLTELHLGNVDTLLDSPTCFPKALASLSSLESIRLEVGPCTCQLLHHLKSRPRTVDLYRPLRRSRDGATHVMLDGYTITCFLPQTLAPVLTRLRLRDCIYIAEELHRAHRTFPTVHTLTLDGRSGELVSIAAAFPNLRHLQLRDVWLDPTQPNALWRRLDHVEISTPDDLFLPVVKPIRRLDVREPIESWQQLGFLKSMLETTRPTVLICPIMYDRVEAWLREPNAHSALLNLKYLHLVLRSVDEDIVLTCARALGDFALAGLSFAYYGSSAVGGLAHDEWISSLACEIAECVPSVSYVGLNLWHCASSTSRDLDDIEWYGVQRREVHVEAARLVQWKGKQVLSELLAST